jgi:hypothetical protein
MLGVDPAIASSGLLLGIAVGSTAMFVIAVCTLALGGSRNGVAAASARFVLVVLAGLSAASMTWAVLGSVDQRGERQAIEMRADRLAAQALLPGSPLACLDALTSDAIQTACEKAVFASPAAVASANSYIAARFALFSDMVAYTRRGGAGIDEVLLPMRHSLEADPFGLLAHVLAMRDGCTSENCLALTLLHDPSHVRMNLIAGTLDHFLERYREAWAKPTDAPVAEAADGTAAVQSTPPSQRKTAVNIDFPTAASIPAVSIMNPEPKGPGPGPAAASAPPASPNQAASTAQPVRRPPTRRAPKPQDDAAAPPAPADAAQTDPVWIPAPRAPAQ